MTDIWAHQDAKNKNNGDLGANDISLGNRVVLVSIFAAGKLVKQFCPSE
jgi:hypothetical protein